VRGTFGVHPERIRKELTMIEGIRYVHTNLIARDWRALVAFYTEIFGCMVVPPERDFAGPDLEAGTGVAGARLAGAHLRLPGYETGGPTLEIFSYTPQGDERTTAVNGLGYGHIAFEVASVEAARDQVLRAGGRAVGEIVCLTTATGKRVTWCYVTDPEGNAIELQSWS